MKSSAIRAWQVMFSLLLVVLLTGCVRETRNGESVKYTYEWWVPISIVLASVVGMVGGWFARSFSERLGWALMLFGVIGFVVGPSKMLEYSMVDDKHCELCAGVPYFASKEEVAFDDVQAVELTKEVRRGRRGRRSTSYYLNFHLKSGQTVKVKVNGHLREEASPLIAEQLALRGIQISGAIDE